MHTAPTLDSPAELLATELDGGVALGYDLEELQQLEELADLAHEFRLSTERMSAAVDRVEDKMSAIRETIRAIDRRLIRVETIIEVTRADGATFRIARDPQ